jgi:hypothetical protein
LTLKHLFEQIPNTTEAVFLKAERFKSKVIKNKALKK